MEQVKNRDVQEERGFYEMPLVGYGYKHLNDQADTQNIEQISNTQQMTEVNEIDVTQEVVQNLTDHDKMPGDLQGASPQKLSYVWVEAFLCAIILIGILIIQNVNNTEGLQLNLRQQIRHNLTADELIAVHENLEDMVQEYKNVTP